METTRVTGIGDSTNTQHQNHLDHKIIYNKRVRVITCDWDAMCKEEITVGRGFRITEKGKSDTDSEAGYYSIHSPLYGTGFDDVNAFEDRYSCKCKRLIGKNFEHKVCPVCGTTVEYIDVDMRITGWIVLDRDCIIQSLFYKKIQSFLGKKNLENIVQFKDLTERETSSNPFDGIGITEFKERFSEVMDFYLRKYPKKLEMYLFIMSQIDQVFAHSIPVYSSHLRPFIIRSEEIKYSDEDKLFRHIFTNSELVNDQYELEDKLQKAIKNKLKSVQYLRKENILYSIQKDINSLWDLTFDSVKKKTGQIRDKILGGRLNYSARNVIIPNKDLRSDELEVGYTTFLELYKLEIVSLLQTMYDIPSTEAWTIWDDATVNFDERVYKVMNYMVTKRNVIVELNRNPTINYGSQLVMRIVKVTPDINDHTMSLPESILTLLNADFDGDVLNIISIKITELADNYYRKLNPLNNVFISRNDGKYNDDTGLFKDQSVGLYAFANI